eukprot:COSAG02_NODE_558_length_20348_cov_6.479431_21_plen_106_part_00
MEMALTEAEAVTMAFDKLGICVIACDICRDRRTGCRTRVAGQSLTANMCPHYVLSHIIWVWVRTGLVRCLDLKCVLLTVLIFERLWRALFHRKEMEFFFYFLAGR